MIGVLIEHNDDDCACGPLNDIPGILSNSPLPMAAPTSPPI